MLHHSLVTLIVTETVTRDECNVTMISLLIKITLNNIGQNHMVIEIFLEMISCDNDSDNDNDSDHSKVFLSTRRLQLSGRAGPATTQSQARCLTLG